MSYGNFMEWYENSWRKRDKDGVLYCDQIKKQGILKDYSSALNKKHTIGKDLLERIKQKNLDTLKKDFYKVPPPPTPISDEEKVVKILKTEFEAKHGMTFDKFIEVYNKLLKDNPEKLI